MVNIIFSNFLWNVFNFFLKFPLFFSQKYPEILTNYWRKNLRKLEKNYETQKKNIKTSVKGWLNTVQNTAHKPMVEELISEEVIFNVYDFNQTPLTVFISPLMVNSTLFPLLKEEWSSLYWVYTAILIETLREFERDEVHANVQIHTLVWELQDKVDKCNSQVTRQLGAYWESKLKQILLTSTTLKSHEIAGSLPWK